MLHSNTNPSGHPASGVRNEFGPNIGAQTGQNFGTINNTFGSFLSENDRNNECLRALAATDPHKDKKRIQDDKGDPLKAAYKWILVTDEYKEWRDRDGRFLWIRGDPGKGKTMLLCGIIDELQKQSSEKTPIIGFFFCQATDVGINNAQAGLRGLINLLTKERTRLVHHIRKRYDRAGEKLFKDPNSWVALSVMARTCESAYDGKEWLEAVIQRKKTTI
ncbi:hypothetical protein VTJ83DRAFT_2672 [Remersonia thermophila]|uniref:NACHT domain-containing protein n=1 Tax=Remersonia thermophila TaxID=72144 RepID=A0ABR4DJE2_9PEZI